MSPLRHTTTEPSVEKSRNSRYFFALNIGLSEITAAIWQPVADRVKILGQAVVPYRDKEELSEKSHHILNRLVGDLEIKPQEILFGVPDSWCVGDALKEPYLRLLQKMISEFGLKSLAYVTTISAISYLIQKKENALPDAVLLGLGDFVEVTLLRNGETVKSWNFKQSGHLFEDIEKTVRELISGGSLPSRLLIYSTKRGMDMQKIKDELTSFNWMQSLPFSEVEILGENVNLEAIVLAGVVENDSGAGSSIGELLLTIPCLADSVKNRLFHSNRLVLAGAVFLILLTGFEMRGVLSKQSGQQLDTSGYTEIHTDTPSPVADNTKNQNFPDYSTNNSQVTVSPTSTLAPTRAPSPTPCAASSTADAGHSTLSADPSSAPANSSGKLVITVKIADNCGNLLSGAVINLSTSDSTATFWPANSGSNITNSLGQAQFDMTSATAGTDQINVQSQLKGTTVLMDNLGSVTFSSVTPTSSPTPTPTPNPTPTP